VQTLPLIPKRDMCEIKGSYLQLTQKSFYENTTYTSDYMHVTLTDEEDVPDALAKLRVIYKNLMKLDYDNARTRFNGQITAEAYVERKSPLELFADLYTMQNNQDMTATQREFMQTLIERIWEEEK
jgi:exonuclease SbcD